MRRLLVVLALLTAPVHARADPITASIAAIAKALTITVTVSAQYAAIASAIATAWNATVISFVLGKVSTLLAGASSVTAQTYTLRSSKAAMAIIYGQVRASGVVIFEGVQESDTKYLWRVLAIAGHQCEAMSDVWLGSDFIADSDIDAGTGEVTGGDYAGKLCIWRLLGGSTQTALSALNSAFTEITDDHKGQGIAMIVTRMERDDTVYTSGGGVDTFVLVKGKRVYDPRLDSTNGGSGSHRYDDATTWAWSDNAALCAADYVTGGSMVFDTATPINRLGMRVPPERINWDLLTASANKCQETVPIPGTTQIRYGCNGVLSCEDTHETNLDAILGSMRGNRVFTAGKYNIYAGAYDTPSETITDDDLKDSGYKVQGATTGSDVFNQVCGAYYDFARGWQETTSFVRTSTAFEFADGRAILNTLSLPMVTNEYQAQRISEIEKQQSRNQITVELNLKLSGLRVAPWDTFYLALSDMGWTDKVFRAMSIEMNLSERLVKISAKEESSVPYADLDDDEYNVAGSSDAGKDLEFAVHANASYTMGVANVEAGNPGTADSDTITAKAVGGAEPYMYRWALLNGTVATISDATVPDPYFSATGTLDGHRINDTARCVVTDDEGRVVYVDVAVILMFPSIV